jgi:hypothetical protein
MKYLIRNQKMSKMKLSQYVLIIVVLLTLNLSCSKSSYVVDAAPNSALTAVNAVIGSNPVIVNFTNNIPVQTYYSTTQRISYGSSYEYSIVSNSTPVTVFQTTDTLHPEFQGTLQFQPNLIYSLFLSGVYNSQNQPDTLLTVDNPPYYPASDSMTGVRFVNLSPGSNPIAVNIKGNANGSEVSNLAYKAITSFKAYPATSKITQYIFEIRDATSGVLLTSYSYNKLARFKNVTVVLSGMNGGAGSNAIRTFLVNNY